jgi:hypothetical protein
MPDFLAFVGSIVSPALKQVALHWNEARDGRKMPAWSDIKPSAIKAQLPIVWAYKYDAQKDEFIGRLAGDQIVSIFGKSFRGLPLSDAHPAEAFAWIFALLKKVVSEPALYQYDGRVFSQLNRYGAGERIMLPLSADGRESDGILGATCLRLATLQKGI